jgi:hypothetical protein
MKTSRPQIPGQLELPLFGDDDQAAEPEWVTSDPDASGQVIKWRQVE